MSLNKINKWEKHIIRMQLYSPHQADWKKFIWSISFWPFIPAFYSRPNTLGQWDPTILNTHLCTCTAFALTVRIFDMASNPRYFTVNRIVTLVTRGHLANVAKVLKILNKMQINWHQMHFNKVHNYFGSMSLSEQLCTHPSPSLKSTLRFDWFDCCCLRGGVGLQFLLY